MMTSTASEASISSHFILIRGLARESRHWGDFPANLAKVLSASGENVRVDTIDLPGAGRYSEACSPISMGRTAEFVRSKWLELREKQRKAGERPASSTYLIAVSLGGMVATRWMERWPDDLKGCVLMNTSFKGFSPVFKRLHPNSYRHFFHIVKERDAYHRELKILKLISNRPEIHEVTARAWEKIQHDRPVSLENFSRQLVAAARFEPTLLVPPIPVMVLRSEKDRMVDPSCSEAVAKRWHAELKSHPTAGHDLPLDDPQWVIEEIRGFYSRHK